MIEVTYVDHMGDDMRVVDAARVSFSKKADNYTEEDNHKLINYLAKHEHFSPFNHTFITLHCKAPIFVARQLQKHEYMPWNEVSRRYVKDEPEFYRPELRLTANDVKQGSSDEVLPYDHELYDDEVEILGSCFLFYESLISKGVAPEVARAYLPQATMTEWYWSGTLKAWAKMFNLRAAKDAQRETQEVAVKAGEIISELFPVSWRALTSHD